MFRAVLDEIYLPAQIVLEIVLAHVKLENEGLSGLAGNERWIQPLDRRDQGIVTIIQAAVGIDSGSDGYEARIERHAFCGFCSDCKADAEHVQSEVQVLPEGAFFDRFAQQKPIKACGAPTPPARQRPPEYGVHPHVLGNSQPEILPLPLYPDVVEAPLDDLVGNAQALLLEYLVQSG